MEFSTVAGNAEAEIIINRSKFIAATASVESDEAAIEFINAQQARFPDATHHCYAYIIGQNGLNSRHSDDGEPSGTAGMPILDVIKGNLLTNTVIVVTRYFGGILLGTGGLVRAYSSAAKAAVEKAGIVKYAKCGVYSIELDYPIYSRFDRLKNTLLILNTSFEDKVRMKLAIKTDDEEKVIKEIVDICLGQAKYERLAEAFYPIS